MVRKEQKKKSQNKNIWSVESEEGANGSATLRSVIDTTIKLVE